MAKKPAYTYKNNCFKYVYLCLCRWKLERIIMNYRRIYKIL